MNIKDALREMRHVSSGDYGTILITWISRWADTIEAAMREKDAEIERLTMERDNARRLVEAAAREGVIGLALADVERLKYTLRGIEIYASDTLSKPMGAPDDRKWYRDGVIEIVKRVRAALNNTEDKG